MTIIVTGSSKGIGLAIADYLAKKGHKVYGLSRKPSPSTYFESILVDVGNNEEIKNAIASILSKEKQIDVLINNAGMGMVGSVEDSDAESISRLFQLNLIGAVQMIQAVLPKMREQKSGKILNISSIGSEMGLPFRGFYSASKSALDKVTEALRYEVYPWKLQACVLHLGDIKTNIAQHRVQVNVSENYSCTFAKVHHLMNAHVHQGLETEKVAIFVGKLLEKENWKAHYSFGKLGQKIAIPLKKILPQRLFEFLMRKYNKID